MNLQIFFSEALNEPLTYVGLGVSFLILAIWIPYYSHKEAYRRFWKGLKKFVHGTHRFFTMLTAFIAIVGFVGTYFAISFETVRGVAPALYDWTAPYERVFFLIFWGTVALNCIFKASIMSDRQDDGIINDIDSEKKSNEHDGRIMALEDAIQILLQREVQKQEVFYETKGEKEGRLEKNPKPPIGKLEERLIVREDPTVPPTVEEFRAKILPVSVKEEEKPFSSENVSEPEEETETKKKPDKIANPYGYDSKLDRLLLGNIGKKTDKK
jgi:hypothetical protein